MIPVKKFITALLSFILLLPSAAFGQIYDYDETSIITKGASLRQIRRFLGDGWLNISCVSADLTDPNIKLDLLKSDADSLMTVDAFTKTQEGVVAAANADFFDATLPSSSQGFSLGIEIKDGELLQSQIDESMAAAFYDGSRLALSYMSMSVTVTAPNGASTAVRHLNKHTDYYGDVLMYTSRWNNGNSPAPGGEVVEVVVENDVITDIRRGLPSVKIPENGYVLDVSEGVNMFFGLNTQVGDALTLNISVTPDIENVSAAFGGGTMLLKDGEKTPVTHSVPGRNPRTCVGTNADGTVVYIITVDGRQTYSRGATLSELADIALELGCSNALNLDGGGSTRMMAKTFWDSDLHVVNSPTENRKVINAVSIVSGSPSGEAVAVKLKTDRDTVLAGDSVGLSWRVCDENENPVWNYGEEPVFNVSGVSGGFYESSFIPSSGGRAEITASYMGEVTDTAYVDVISLVHGISLPQNINLGVGQSISLMPEVYGADGIYAFVQNVSLLSPSVSDTAVASLENGTLTGLNTGWAVLTLTHSGAKAYSLIKVGEPQESPPFVEANVYTDEMEGRLNGGNSFGIFAFGREPYTFFDNFHYIEGLQKLSVMDTYAFLGEYDKARLPEGMRTPFFANNFNITDKGFALVVSIPSSGVLSASNWIDLANRVASTEAKSVVFLTKTTPAGANDNETQVFYDYLEFIAKEKNVLVVQPGNRNDAHARGNVRFITLSDAGSFTSVGSAIENSSYLRLTFQGDECRYEFLDVFNNVF